MKLEVFDPPMCCSTGICGTEIDPVLPRFAADLEWLKTQSVSVTRYNLAQEPGAFVNNETVKAALHAEGNACLPLILVEEQIISRTTYPDRVTLAEWIGIGVAAVQGAAPVKQTLPVLTTPSKCC